MDDKEFSFLKQQIQVLTGIDLENYKSEQMRRRLEGFLSRTPDIGVEPYCKLLARDAAALQRLKDFLTINVSEFFRDTAQFEVLKAKIIPNLLDASEHLRVWSAGCSIGAEAYSMAMILAELQPKGAHRIFGTDLDTAVLSKAKAGGPYTAADVKNVPRHLLLKYFTHPGDDYYIVDKIKEKVTFQQHNLLKDPFSQGFDLIVCRNVVIYFADEAKRKLNKEFCNSLKEHGVLFIGSTETLLDAQELGLKRVSTSFYQKVPLAEKRNQEKQPLKVADPSPSVTTRA